MVARLHDEEVAIVGVTAEAASADEAALREIGIETVVSADELATLAGHVVRSVLDPLPLDTPITSTSDGRAAPDAEGRPVRRGRLVAVWGATGAPGRSTVALGVGAELARLRASTLVVDADVYGGSLAAMLGMLDESSGLLAAAREANVGALHHAQLACHARQINDALRVLTGIPRADRWTEVKAVLLRRVLEAARALAAYTVVDCGFSLELDEEISYDTAAPRRNGATVEALERADTIVVVGAADPVGLARLIRAVHELSVVLPAASPYIVVNRVRPGLGWSGDEIVSTVARATGNARVSLVPDDRATCDRALVHGRTLTECAPDAKITRAMRGLAVEVSGRVDAARPRKLALRRR